MTSGTSDTWWPSSFLEIDLWVKTEAELVEVISERQSNSGSIKFKSQTIYLSAFSVSFGRHLTYSYNDLSNARRAITSEVYVATYLPGQLMTHFKQEVWAPWCCWRGPVVKTRDSIFTGLMLILSTQLNTIVTVTSNTIQGGDAKMWLC